MTRGDPGLAHGWRRLDRRGTLVLFALLVVPASVLAIARAVPALDPTLESPVFHLYVVSAIAALALLLAIVTAVFADRDGRAARS